MDDVAAISQKSDVGLPNTSPKFFDKCLKSLARFGVLAPLIHQHIVNVLYQEPIQPDFIRGENAAQVREDRYLLSTPVYWMAHLLRDVSR